MGNCLETKLKSVVNNDNLVKINVLRLRVRQLSEPSKSSQSLRVVISGQYNISVTGGGYFGTTYESIETQRLTSINCSDDTTLYLANGNYYIFITSKYDLERIFITCWPKHCIYNPKLDDLKYCEKIKEISMEGNDLQKSSISFMSNMSLLERLYIAVPKNTLRGDISVFASMQNLNNCRILDGNCTGDISIFSDKTNLTFLQLSNSDVYGNISSFTNLINLNKLFIHNTSVTGQIESLGKLINLNELYVADTEVTGDIDTFALAQISNGRNSGSIRIYTDNLSGVTYKGNPAWDFTISFNGDGTYNVV